MLIHLFRITLIVSFFFSNGAFAKENWQLTKEENGIQIYVHDNPSSSLKVFKGVLVIPDTRLSSLVAVLEDTKVMPQLLHNCKSAKLIQKKDKLSSTLYIINKMPWPVKNRDSIVHSVMNQDKKTKTIRIKMQSQPNKIPKKKGMIRVQSMSGYWELMPLDEGGKSGKVRVTYELSVDPGGNLPKWLVNTLAVDFPFYTLQNLRQLVKKAAYKNAQYSYVID